MKLTLTTLLLLSSLVYSSYYLGSLSTRGISEPIQPTKTVAIEKPKVQESDNLTPGEAERLASERAKDRAYFYKQWYDNGVRYCIDTYISSLKIE